MITPVTLLKDNFTHNVSSEIGYNDCLRNVKDSDQVIFRDNTNEITKVSILDKYPTMLRVQNIIFPSGSPKSKHAETIKKLHDEGMKNKKNCPNT